MSRLSTVLLLSCVGLGVAGAASAEGRHKVPIQHDLQRMEAIDSRLARSGSLPLDVEETGSIGTAPVVTPYSFGERYPGYGFRAHGDPSGVVGFSGPPGIYGDSVNSFSPLPPGSPANLDGQW